MKSGWCSLLFTLKSENSWEGGWFAFVYVFFKMGPVPVGSGGAQAIGKLCEDSAERAGPLRHLATGRGKNNTVITQKMFQ